METGLKTQNSKRNKEFQIRLLAEAAIQKKSEKKKPPPSGQQCNDLG